MSCTLNLEQHTSKMDSMSKSPRRRNPIEQHDQFMIGGKTASTPRGMLLLVGGFVGNSVLWLTGLVTVARLGMLLAFILVTAVTYGVIQLVSPSLEFTSALLISAINAVIVITIGVIILKAVLRRDAQHLGQQPTFGVFDEDARHKNKQNHRRKSGR